MTMTNDNDQSPYSAHIQLNRDVKHAVSELNYISAPEPNDYTNSKKEYLVASRILEKSASKSSLERKQAKSGIETNALETIYSQHSH